MKIDENSDHEVFEDYDEIAHKRLLQNISSVTRTQHIKKATRSEPSIKTGEFNLSKASKFEDHPKLSASGQVTVQNLLKIFKKTDKHNELGKTLLKTQRVKKRLEKPLEKVHADKIQRAVGYEKTKNQLNRWDAIVAKNAMAEQLVFPLQVAGEVDIYTPKTLETFRFKSDLMRTMESLMPEKKPDETGPSEFALTLDEIKERAKEQAKIRMRESYKMAKGRRQNKIKSKKFHRLMKRDKVKQQLKDFELLQKTDPDAALQKLEQIERQRALERTSLRHKNTGSWAQNLQIRAKYDESARKELAEQLTISRELTQKQLVESESEEDREDENGQQKLMPKLDVNNPWMKGQLKQADDEIENFVSGYRKYWNERNHNEKAVEDYKSMEMPTEVESETSSSDSEDETNIENFKAKVNRKSEQVNNGWVEEDVDETPQNETSSSDSESDDQFVDDKTIETIFEDVEENIERKIARKLQKIRQDLAADADSDDTSGNKKSAKWKQDLSFKKSTKRVELDEELNEVNSEGHLESLRKKIGQNESTKSTAEDEINPDKFVQIKPKHLKSALPDEIANLDEDDDDGDEEIGEGVDRKLTIAEAFEDDDIVADFEQEKQDEVDRSKPKDIELTLPGWGSWGGTGLENRKQKKKVIKAPENTGRKDQRKDRIIINEDPIDKLKEHLVHDLPFPFTSVKDYEASLRTPLGRTFVPETVHRVLTKPALVTKLGHIIRPMDETMLLQKKRMRVYTKTGEKVAALEKEEEEGTDSSEKKARKR